MKKISFAIFPLLFVLIFKARVAFAAPSVPGAPGGGLAPGCTYAPEKYTGVADIPSLACLADVVARLINIAFVFLGAACLIFLLYGALLFILSRGDQKAVQKARGTMTYAVIGAVFVALSFLFINIATHLLGLPSFLTNFTFYQP